MTMDAPASAVIVETPVSAAGDDRSYVDWPAIIAGVVLAAAISLVLLAFGSAVGLGFTDFRAREGANPIWIAIAAGSWLLWVQISSFMAGGYLTGRLRKRFNDATEDESDIRDGAHGLLVWAGALIVGAVIAIGGITGLATAVGGAASTLTQAASNVADDASGLLDPNAYFVDTLLRPAPAGGPANVDTAPARDEAGRIFANAALAGELPADDRTYLAQLVAAKTGLTEEEAGARVDQAVTSIEAARQAALDAAEAARRTAVVAAFLTAASLLVSAIGAFWAAQKGGDHRDKQTAFPGVFRRF